MSTYTDEWPLNQVSSAYVYALDQKLNMANNNESENVKRIEEKVASRLRENHYLDADTRELCREGFKISLPGLISIAKGETHDASAASRIRANDNLGKYGFGKRDMFVQDNRIVSAAVSVTAKFLKDPDLLDDWYAELNAALLDQ